MPHQSELFIVTVRTPSGLRKVFQLIFQKRDGSLFVNFPYFERTDGLLSLVTWPAGYRGEYLDLERGGKVVSHLVKYSHHPDGRVQFSQDGKIISAVKKQGRSITTIEGHEFTFQIQGVRAFKFAEESELSVKSQRRMPLCFEFKEEPVALKFLSHWHSRKDFAERSIDGVTGPKAIIQSNDGKQWLGFLLSAPDGHPAADRVMTLSCEIVDRLSEDETLMVFAGGFDEKSVVGDFQKETTFLTLKYPLRETEKVTERVGSIDLKSRSVV